MFTGIIEALGKIGSIDSRGQDLSLTINTRNLDLSDVQLGDSIGVNGVCLTVVKLMQQAFVADVSAESLIHTVIGSYSAGTKVNLEKALTLSSRLGGHLVSGHVDGIGTIVKRKVDGRSIRFELECGYEIQKYIANKGSITIDGVSLTVTGLTEKGFTLNIVPHTVAETTIQGYMVGNKVHIEVDLMARYAERLLSFEGLPKSTLDKISEKKSPSGLDHAFLAEHGFLQ